MRTLSITDDVTTTLKGMASGASLAACVLLPTGSVAAEHGARSASVARTVTPTVDVSGEFSYVATPHGLESDVVSQTHHSSPTAQLSRDTDPPNLAQQLKDASGLGTVPLHRIVGVSRQRFHEWLRGGGVGADKVARIQRLIAVFYELRSILGPDLRGFVKSETPAGRIEDLLIRGMYDRALGLALLPPQAPVKTRPVSYLSDGHASQPSWLTPIAQLDWGGTSSTHDQSFIDALEDLAPSAAPEVQTQITRLTWQPRSVTHISHEP